MSKSFLSKIKQSALMVMIVVIISKLIGMLRDVVLANYYGTSNVSDAYLIAVSVPTLLFYFIGHALSTAFLPIYEKIKIEKSEKDAVNYMNNLLCVSILLCFIIVVILLIFPTSIVKLFAIGFDVETTKIAVKIIRISAPSLFFMAIVNIWSAYLHSKNNFVLPASISLPRNISIVISIIIAATYGIEWLGIGLLFAYIFEFIVLIPSVFRNGYKPQLLLNFKDDEVKETVKLVAPIFIGSSVSQINKIIDRTLASALIVGGVTALTYASMINNAVQEILVTSIITILFANCSRLIAEGDFEEVKKKLSKVLNTLIILLLPASIGIIVLSKPLVQIFFARGSFDEQSLDMTYKALCCYSSGLVFIAIRDTFIKVFYALKKTKIITIFSIISILINIILNFVLSDIFGLNGLAIATVISIAINAICLYILTIANLGNFGVGNNLYWVMCSVISSIVMAIIVNYSFYNLSLKIESIFTSTVLSVILGILVYFCVMGVLNIKKIILYFKNKRFKNELS